MAHLTTESPASAFRKNLKWQGLSLRHLTDVLEREYHQFRGYYHKTSSYYGTSAYTRLDKEVLTSSSAMALAMLEMMVEKIVDAEDYVDSLVDSDADTGSFELAHAQGELFAVKAAYISLVSTIGDFESARQIAYTNGMPVEQYNNRVLDTSHIIRDTNRHGVPEIITDTNDQTYYSVKIPDDVRPVLPQASYYQSKNAYAKLVSDFNKVDGF